MAEPDDKKITDHSIDLTSFESDQQLQMDVQSVNSFYILAQDAFNQKRYRLAIIYLRKILQIDNSFVSAFKMLAKIFQIRRNYKKAAEILRQAVESNFRDAELHYQLGYLYYLQGDQAAFARECTKALVVNPNYAKAFYALALLNFENRKYSKAQEELTKCLRLNENDLDAHLLMARLFFRKRDFTSARKHLQKVLQLNNNHQLAHYYLGGVSLILEDYEAAIEHYLQAPESPKVRFRVQKSFEIIKGQLEQKLRREPDSIGTLMDLASLYFKLGKYAEAKITLQKILKKHPEYIQAAVNYGLMLIYENNYLEGIKVYRDVLSKSPANREARLNMQKAFTLAEEYYLQHLKYDRSKQELLEIYMYEEKYDKAVLVMYELSDDSYAREILARLTNKSLPVYKVFQGAVLFLLGEIAEARYLLEHLEEADKSNPAIYYFLGLIAKDSGKLTEAYRYFEKSRLLDPEYWFAEQELLSIRQAEMARLEKLLEEDEVEIEVCLEYIDLLILTGAYKKALLNLVDFKKMGVEGEEFDERMKKVVDLYEHELEMDMENEEPVAETYLDLGEIYVYKKRYNDAFLLFQTALNQYPEEQRLQKFYTYLVTKNIEVYEAMLKTEDKTMVYYNLAVFYAISGRRAEMFTMLEKAVNKDKKLAIQARYEDAFKKYREMDRFRLITLIEGEDKNIYMVQD